MAEQVLRELLGDAIADLMSRHEHDISRNLDRVREWLGEAAEPPPGVELKAIDGSKYSGVGVFEKNRLVVLLALRHPVEEHVPIATPPSRLERPMYVDPYLDPDDPKWDRDGDPFRR